MISSLCSPPAILDIEASGFGADSYPIEVGLVKADGQRYCRLIQPLPNWTHWTHEAESLHGITRELLHSNGGEIVEICQQLNQLLEGTTIYCDGWVVDYPWLIKLFAASGQSMKFTCSPLEAILNESQMDIWHEEKARLCAESGCERHRASSDAEMIQRLYVVTRQLSGTPASEVSF